MIAKRRSHLSRRGALIRGTASDSCAGIAVVGAPVGNIRHVFVMIYRQLAHGKCRFLGRHGKLARARSCMRPLRIRARGTKRFTLRLKVAIAPGRYVVRSDAVDDHHHHQRRSTASRLRARVR
jgi:hypothetical protein